MLLSDKKPKPFIEQLRRKQHLTALLGGSCLVCQSTSIRSLQFHHLDRNKKSFTIGSNSLARVNIEALEKEAKKCVLLCANCHHAVEAGEASINNSRPVNLHQKFAFEKNGVKKRTNRCPLHVKVDNQCKECKAIRIRKFRRATYETLLDIHNSECNLCGFNDYLSALQFHHICPDKKLFAIGRQRNSKTLESLIEESKKCVLLCANCHIETEYGKYCQVSFRSTYSIFKHYDLIFQKRLENKHFLAELAALSGNTRTLANYLQISCPIARNHLTRHKLDLEACYELIYPTLPLRSNNGNNKNCIDCSSNVRGSQRCSNCYKIFIKENGKKKICWPSTEIILKELETKSYQKLGRELQVSDNAIRKHLKSKGVVCPKKYNLKK